MNTAQILTALGAMAKGGAGEDNSEQLRRLKELSQSQDAGPEQGMGAGFAGYQAGRSAGAGGVVRGPEFADQRQAGRAAYEASRMAAQTNPYGYQYTPQAVAAGAPPGQRYGVTAQDLEKTPVGKAFVNKDPNTGFKTVDTAGLTMANTAAIGQLVRSKEQEQQQGRDMLAALRQQKADTEFGNAFANKQAATLRLQQLARL